MTTEQAARCDALAKRIAELEAQVAAVRQLSAQYAPLMDGSASMSARAHWVVFGRKLRAILEAELACGVEVSDG